MLDEKEPFLDAMKNRILLFDGAMGTEIQRYDPKPEDFPNNQDGFNDGLVITHPEWIKQIHRNYLDAGADCIETNSLALIKLNLLNMVLVIKPSNLIKKLLFLHLKFAKNTLTNNDMLLVQWVQLDIFQVPMILIWVKYP